MKRFTALFVRILSLAAMGICVSACVNHKLEEDAIERQLVTINIRPPQLRDTGEPGEALASRSGYFAADDEIADLRILIFRAADGLLAYNQYWSDITQSDAQPMTVRLMTGIYHFVFVANECSDPILSAQLEAYTGTKSITDLESLSFASEAVSGDQLIPMTSAYRNVTILGDRKLTYHRNDDPSQTYDASDPILTVNGDVWGIKVERLAVRIDLTLKTETLQLKEKFTGIEIDHVPNHIRLLKKKADGTLNPNNTGEASGYETSRRSIAAHEGGAWATEGTDYVWTMERIIVPENAFSDKSNEAKALSIRAVYDDGRYVSGTVGLNEPTDHSLPRNVLVDLTGRLNMPITFQVNVADWNTRKEIYLPNYHITFRDEYGNDIEWLSVINSDDPRELSVHWAPETAILKVEYMDGGNVKETGALEEIKFIPEDYIRPGDEYEGGYHLYENLLFGPITQLDWSGNPIHCPVAVTEATYALFDENGAEITDWQGEPLRKTFRFLKKNTDVVVLAEDMYRSPQNSYSMMIYSNTYWKIKKITEKNEDGTILPAQSIITTDPSTTNRPYIVEGYECLDSMGSRYTSLYFVLSNDLAENGSVEVTIESPLYPKSFEDFTFSFDVKSKLYAGGTGFTHGFLPQITGWANSNVYWVPSDDLATYPDGGYLTFDYYPGNPFSQNAYQKQGLFFRWGSLIGWGAGTTGTTETVFVPSEAVDYLADKLTGTAGNYQISWTNVPTATSSGLAMMLGDDYNIGSDHNPHRQRHHMLEHHVPERATGDICKYITDKGWAPDGGNWRMPSSMEFGLNTANYSTPTGMGGKTDPAPPGTWLYGYGLMSGYTTFKDGAGTPLANFPASGYLVNNTTQLAAVGTYGHYWTGTVHSRSGDNYSIYKMQFSSSVIVEITDSQYHGESVRCVRDN